MRITRSKARVISELTIDQNVDMLTYILTNLGAPVNDNDSARKKYVDDLAALYLLLAGGTMSGNIAMGTKKLTGLGAPTSTNDSLRYGVAEIRNNEIKAAAGIVESKLSLNVATNTLNTKIGTDIATHAALKTGIHGRVLLVKPDDEIQSNSEAMQNDDDLVLPVGADDIWIIWLFLKGISPTATPDIDYAFTVPGGGVVGYITDVQTLTGSVINSMTGAFTFAVDASGKVAAAVVYYFGGGTAGSLQLQWAQNVATVEDTKLQAGSFMDCFRIV